jgi:hypothetical protein
MNAVSNRWRRWAVRLALHAASVMPGARSPWADAMRRELDYIPDDAAALRWALGSVLASYRSRLTHRPWLSARPAWRHVAAGGAVMLLVGLTLQVNAEGQTEPLRPAPNETICDRADVSPQIVPNGEVSVRRNHDNTHAERVRPDCADRDLPNRPEAERDR